MAAYYLAFYKGRKRDNPDTSFFDRLICLVTQHRFSHVELVFRYHPETNIGVSWTSSPRDGGVRMANIKFNPNHWELFEYTGDLPLEMKENPVGYVNDWFIPKAGMKYDWVGAVGTIIRFIKQVEDRYFCSEIVSEFFRYTKPSTYTPKKLFNKLSPYLVKIPL